VLGLWLIGFLLTLAALLGVAHRRSTSLTGA